MNEDDTFNTLRRIPYKLLLEYSRLKNGLKPGMMYDPFGIQEIAFLEKYNWTELALKKEYRRHLIEVAPDANTSHIDAEIIRLENNERG